MSSIYLTALPAMLIVGALVWALSVLINNVSIVDSLWSLLFLIAASVFLASSEVLSERSLIVFTLVTIWSLRLSLHITIRNWGEGEDYRYQAIRAKNEPGFVLKSLYLVFGLQVVLAWIISAPLLPGASSLSPLGWIDAFAVSLWIVGFVFESVGDLQLTKFKADSNNLGNVLNTGLWRYTRHPNYFGDFCVWWAFWLFALSTGAWWTVFAPILMSLLLLKVSGVAMLEKTIGERRPEYNDYTRHTNAFFPGPSRARN